MKKINYLLQGIFFFILFVLLSAGVDYLLGRNIDWISDLITGFLASILYVVFLRIYIKDIKKK